MLRFLQELLMLKSAIFLLLLPALVFCDDQPPPSDPPSYIEGFYLSAQPASFRDSDAPGKFGYNQGQLRFSYMHGVSKCWGLIFGAGYDTNTIEWRENPFFEQKRFGYVDLSIGGYVATSSDFLWSLTLAGYFDTTVLDLSDYAIYEAVLVGNHTLTDEVMMQFGFIIQGGLATRKIWPVFGFEWDGGGPLRIGAVFPLDVAAEYRFSESFSLAAAARFFYCRHRVKESLPTPRSLFQYTNTGIEGQIIYKTPWSLVVEGFVGSTLNGDFKVANQNNDHAIHFKQKPALYGGASASLLF